MELNNSFEIPLAPDQAWKVLLDIARIAPCLPGAELTEIVDPRTYKGKVSVKLGPVALTFNGTVKFAEIVESERRAKVDAQGTDAKGRGGANATAVFALEPSPVGTRVAIKTQLNLSGAVAQYGRGAGMIQSVATQLVGQFADNLRAALATPSSAAASVDTVEAASATAPVVVTSTPPTRPISGFSLLLRALWMSLRRALGAGA